MAEKNAFDRIIGYEDVKAELHELADVLKDPEKYARLGVRPPKGLLLYGVPGIGKTLMAGCLTEASGRKAFTCRKSGGKDSFTAAIRTVFKEASESAPSIVLLDDMDKFANDDEWHINSEEFVTVQTCIDEFCTRGVFVIATANSLDLLPESLIRKGRFDRRIEVTKPDPESAAEIVRHYLADKKTVGDIDCELIAAILGGESCATLETIVNEAGIQAGMADRTLIGMEDMIRACVRVLYNAPAALSKTQVKNMDRIACHEAGHALMAELLEPGSVHLVSICHGSGSVGGVTTSGYGRNQISRKEMEREIMVTLAGRAAVELVFGDMDPGAAGDMKKAAWMINDAIKTYFIFGPEMRGIGDSELHSVRKEEYISRELERYAMDARRLLAENRGMLDRLMQRLMEQHTLVGPEIRDAIEGAAGKKDRRVHAA